MEELLRNILLKVRGNPTAEQLYDKYYNNRKTYHPDLVNGLARVLGRYQDQACLSGIRDGQTLRDIICQMSLIYVPVPLRPEELEKNGSLVNGREADKGNVNGEIYFSQVNGNDIITKIMKRAGNDINEYPNEFLYEAFVNFVILNQFIEQGNTNLIPTYGIFLCDKPKNKRAKPICNVPQDSRTGQPFVYLIQKKINGRTFEDVIDDKNTPRTTVPVTLQKCKRILTQVFNTLIELQESEYQICHNDLNLGNIMVSNETADSEHVWIIDWGIVSFTYNGIRHINYIDEIYGANDNFINGAQDVSMLLDGLYNSERTINLSPIINWAQDNLEQLFGRNLIDEKGIPYNYFESGDLLGQLAEVQSEETYEANTAYLNTLTYRHIAQLLGLNIIPRRDIEHRNIESALRHQSEEYRVQARLEEPVFFGEFGQSLGVKHSIKKRPKKIDSRKKSSKKR